MEKNRTPLSVVIPARNSEATLGRVLEALGRELDKADQLIVVDDGSTDGTRELAGSMKAAVIPNSGRPGAAGARNTGAKKASGDWLLFVDSDAVAPPGWRGMLQSAMDGGPEAVQATYSREAVGEDAATFYKNFYYYYTFTRRIRTRFITGCGTFFFAVNRTRFMELGGFDDRIPGATVEDADFAARLTGSGGSILLAKEIEVLHLRRYTFRDLMSYEWNMMRSKALYLLRRDSEHSIPSVSMARPLEMLPVILGAAAVWPLVIGLVLAPLGLGPGPEAAAAGAAVIGAGQMGFWKEAVATGGWRGFRAVWITFPDLALILPASAAGWLSYLTGRKF